MVYFGAQMQSRNLSQLNLLLFKQIAFLKWKQTTHIIDMKSPIDENIMPIL